MRDMLLPDGKMCKDCRNYNFCKFLFDCPETGYECDWSPSRFVDKSEGSQESPPVVDKTENP